MKNIDQHRYTLEDILMKIIIVLILSINSNFAQAYLVEGVRTTVIVKDVEKNKIKNFEFEGCDQKDCVSMNYKTECKYERSNQWFCYFKKNYPRFVRFSLNLKSSKKFVSNLIPTNGESDLPIFEAAVSTGDLVITPKSK